MVSMDKTDIAKYLRDYAIMIELIRSNPNRKIGDIYMNYMLSNGRFKEYNDDSFAKMVRVYAFITELRIFSFIEEISIDFLNEDDLDFDDIKSKIFVNPDDAKKFSKRQIIRYIRNAFNHNDNEEHSKFNISPNGRYLEIDLLDVRKDKEKISDPNNKKPFHIKIDGKQLQRIREEALKKHHNVMLGGVNYDGFNFDDPFNIKNIENLEYVRIYLNKKVDYSIIEAIWNSDIGIKKTFQDKIELTKSILDTNNYTEYNIERYPFNRGQKEKLREIIRTVHNLNVEAIGKSRLIKTFIHLFSNVIPLGMFHYEQLLYEQQFASWFMDPSLSFSEIENMINNSIMRKEYTGNKSFPEEYSSFDKERYEMLLNVPDDYLVDEILLHRDYYSRIKYPITLYLGYICDSLNNEPEIVINRTKYDSYHIRDSFVHGRWFLGKEDRIELYDCESGYDNDYNFNWSASIDLHKLLEVIDNIYCTKQLPGNKR